MKFELERGVHAEDLPLPPDVVLIIKEIKEFVQIRVAPLDDIISEEENGFIVVSMGTGEHPLECFYENAELIEKIMASFSMDDYKYIVMKITGLIGGSN